MAGRKMLVALALALLLVLVFASAAAAARLGEQRGFDRINGGGGRDIIHADRYGNDRDLVNGGSGNDVIHVDDGDTKDKVNGGSGDYDTCYVDSVSEVVGKTCEDMHIKGGGKREKERAIRRFT
jgi:RTX calcium-binding nonapeptide repeat (4 copies)